MIFYFIIICLVIPFRSCIVNVWQFKDSVESKYYNQWIYGCIACILYMHVYVLKSQCSLECIYIMSNILAYHQGPNNLATVTYACN